MSSAISSSRSSPSHSEKSCLKSHKHSSDEKHHPARLQSNREDVNFELHKHSYGIRPKSESRHSSTSVTRAIFDGNELYRLDDGAEIWRNFDGSVIFWEVHRLTLEDFSQAIWHWAECGLDQIQKSYVASIYPPHGGHQSRLLGIFCPHRQKLIGNHIQRIYSDLYLILRTWTELKHYLRQLNEKSIPQKNSKTVNKIENRLTFHLMVSLREYCGLPLDPKHPDKPSWPPSDEDTPKNVSRLRAEALASPSNFMSKSSGGEISVLLNQDTDSKALCSHCHQVLETSPVEKPAERNVDLLRTPPSSGTQSESSVRSSVSGSNNHKEKTVGKKSTIAQEKKSKSESKSSKDSRHSGSTGPLSKTSGKSDKKSKSKDKSNYDSDEMSLISFDSNQFSNTFGTMFKLL